MRSQHPVRTLSLYNGNTQWMNVKLQKKTNKKKTPEFLNSQKNKYRVSTAAALCLFTSPSLFAGGSSGAGETGEVKGDASSTTGSCSAGSGWTVCSDGGSSSTGSEETKMRRRWSGFIHTVKYSQSNQTCGSRSFLWTTDLVTSDHITNVTQI